MLIKDSVEYRRILCLALGDLPDMRLAGQFATAEVALRSLAALPAEEVPHVILLDLRLPGLGGIDAIPRIHAVAPAARIIVLSQSKEIARRLGIAYGTVDTHVSRLYEKLNVANAPAAVSRAYERGLLSPWWARAAERPRLPRTVEVAGARDFRPFSG